MVKLIGERDTESKAAQALAELYLSLDHTINRLALASEQKSMKGITQPLLKVHKAHRETLAEMIELQGVMAQTQKSWSQWLNETIATAADPSAGLDENPIEAVTTSEARVLNALDDCLRHILTDPMRSTLEHLKQDTLDALHDTPFGTR